MLEYNNKVRLGLTRTDTYIQQKENLPPCGKNCEKICLKASSSTKPLGHSWNKIDNP